MAKKERWQQVKDDIASNPNKYVGSKGNAYNKLANKAISRNASGATNSAASSVSSYLQNNQNKQSQKAPTFTPASQDSNAQRNAQPYNQSSQSSGQDRVGNAVVYGPGSRNQADPSYETYNQKSSQGDVSNRGVSRDVNQRSQGNQDNQSGRTPQGGMGNLSDPNYVFDEKTRREQEDRRAQADKDLLAGLTGQSLIEKENLQEEIGAAQNNYDEQMLRLNDLQKAADEALRKQEEAIAAGGVAMNAAAKEAYERNKAAVDYQRKKTQQAYIEMKNIQELDNAKRQSTLELTMSRYGTYDFAQLKGYQEQIIRNTQKVLNLKKEADIEDQKFTDEVKNVANHFYTKKREIEAWKAEAKSKVYDSYRDYVTKLAHQKNLTTQQKYEAMRSARTRANENLANISAQFLEKQHNFVYESAQRAEDLINERNAAIEKAHNWKMKIQEEDKAKMELLLKNYAGKDYSELTSETRKKMEELEDSVDLPRGFMETAVEKINKELEGKDGFEWHGTKVDNNGNLVAIGVENGRPVAISLGQVGQKKTTANWDIKNIDGVPYKLNKSTGEWQKLSSKDYDEMGESVANEAVNTVVGDAIASTFPEGSHGGQCGSFMHNFVDMTNVGGWGDPIATKKSKMNRSAAETIADVQPGDVLLTNENKVNGHMVIATEKIPPNKVRITESNYHLDERVNNTRIIDLDNLNRFQVLGSYRGRLKPRFESIRKKAAQEVGYVDLEKEMNKYGGVVDNFSKYGLVGGAIKTGFDAFTGGGNGSSKVPTNLSGQDKLNYLADNYGVVLTGEKKKTLLKRNSQKLFEKLVEQQEKKNAPKEKSTKTTKSTGAKEYF